MRCAMQWVLVCGCLAATCALGCGRRAAPPPTAPVTPAADPAAGAQLWDAATLAARLEETPGDVLPLDARSAEAYAAGRVPGAARIDIAAWKAQMLAPGGPVDTQFWTVELVNLAIEPQDTLIVYADDLPTAARAWWTLRYLGLPNVGLLDGGWPAWQGAALPVETGDAEPPDVPGGPLAAFQSERLAGFEQVAAVVADKVADTIVVDTRSDDEYCGRDVRGPRGGHIPGAVHIDWRELVDTEGRFKPVAELQTLFAQRGLDSGQTVITHCQTGGRASVAIFALERAGYGDVKNYYAGWQEWSAKQEAPVEVEEEDGAATE